MNKQDLLSSVSKFNQLKILVIGDVILDAYYKGEVSRISPEAPVPVLDIHTKDYRLGGAANVALNVKNLGASCILCSVIGDDDAGKSVSGLMQDEGLDTSGIIQSSSRKTSQKTRMVSGFSQLLRFDEEITTDLEQKDEENLLHRISSLIETHSPQAIIFEDYDKGCLTKSLIASVIKTAVSKGIKVTVDPKKKNFFSYTGATLFKPNMKELREGLNMPHLKSNDIDLMKAYSSLQEKMPVESAFFTLSADGVFITDGDEQHHLAALNRTIADVSGAGDTVISAATCALSVGMDLKDIATISNLAGGWVCQFPGVVSITQSDLLAEINKSL